MSSPALAWVMQGAGVALIVLILLDVFLTVLYARVGTGIFSHHLACLTWWVFRAGTSSLVRRRDTLLSFCGPVTLVLLIGIWLVGLMCGAALVIKPNLGTSITATTQGSSTPTDFITAVYVAGDSMTTVGTSDLAPRTGLLRLFYVFNSLIGLCVITLTLTYLLEIYNALHRRNTLALRLHLVTAETGDAAELIAGLGPEGRFDQGYTYLAELGADLAGAKESHHFYSVLLYFRFREPYYAVARITLVALDAATLIKKSALDDAEYAWLKESAAVSQLWRASMHTLTLLAVAFLPGGLPEQQSIDEETRDRWRARYAAAVRRLQEAGIRTTPDEQAGAENYIALRARWDRYITAFAEHMAHGLDTIDPVGCNPARTDDRPEFRTRLRSAG